MTFASLIVSAWNRPELLKPFFESLWANTECPYELIVHDDGSQPETADYLHELVKRGDISTLISNPAGHNRGHGTSVNRAAFISEGEYIVKLNGDECFAKGWLTQGIKAMRLFPEVALLHLAHYYSYGPRHVPIQDVIWDMDPCTLHREEREGVAIRVVWVGPGCAFMVSRKTWEEKGPWTSAYSPRFGEDFEYRIRVCPMMRLLPISKSIRYPPVTDSAAHWHQYKHTPWLAALDPPMVSYHPGHALCSIGEAVKTMQRGPCLLGER